MFAGQEADLLTGISYDDETYVEPPGDAVAVGFLEAGAQDNSDEIAYMTPAHVLVASGAQCFPSLPPQ